MELCDCKLQLTKRNLPQLYGRASQEAEMAPVNDTGSRRSEGAQGSVNERNPECIGKLRASSHPKFARVLIHLK